MLHWGSCGCQAFKYNTQIWTGVKVRYVCHIRDSGLWTVQSHLPSSDHFTSSSTLFSWGLTKVLSLQTHPCYLLKTSAVFAGNGEKCAFSCWRNSAISTLTNAKKKNPIYSFILVFSKYLSIASLCSSLLGIRERAGILTDQFFSHGAGSLVGRDWQCPNKYMYSHSGGDKGLWRNTRQGEWGEDVGRGLN